jgi:hypothetical protein
MNIADRTYYLRRAVQEDATARVAGCDEAQQSHLKLAEAYRARCRSGWQGHVRDDEEVIGRPFVFRRAG